MPKSDLYLKTVLTVIAFALLWIGWTLNAQPVHAQNIPRVVISGIDLDSAGPTAKHLLPIGIAATRWDSSYGTTGIWRNDSVPVSISNHKPLAVTIAKDAHN